MILKVPSSLTHSVIYDFGDSFGLAFKIFYKIILIQLQVSDTQKPSLDETQIQMKCAEGGFYSFPIQYSYCIKEKAVMFFVVHARLHTKKASTGRT